MRFLLGFITSTVIISLMFIGSFLYLDFSISTNDEKQEEVNTQQEKNNDEKQEEVNTQQPQQEKINDNQQKQQQQQKRLPNLHNKQKAMNLMKQERSNLSEEDKKIYDGVIDTARKNIHNGVGNQEDYNILNEYQK